MQSIVLVPDCFPAIGLSYLVSLMLAAGDIPRNAIVRSNQRRLGEIKDGVFTLA